MANVPFPTPTPPRRNRAFWRDDRFIQITAQLAIAAIVAGLLYLAFQNMAASLARQGIALGFGFLDNAAGFDLGESLIRYASTDTFGRALLAGLLNTVLVSALGIALSTLLGILVGIARLSGNWLVNRLAWLFIELMRNVPLLVLLVFIYTALFLKLPRVRQAISAGPIYLSNRGVAIPWGEPTETWTFYLGWLITAAGLAILTVIGLRTWQKRSGRPKPIVLPAALVWTILAVAGWVILPQPPLQITQPQIAGFNFQGGRALTPEFMALLLGLVIYTAGFIGEVVRAGIQSVPKGQVEAARALGLSGQRTLQLIVFPQALRVIIPPLTSQYLNLTKNSSLAVAIGYPDLFGVAGTIINQTGRAVEMIAIVMAVYLFISLLTSILMNWYNRRVRLVER